jgi:hypothetical protein
VFGKFPLYTDEDIDGDLVDLLRRQGWDLVRAVERHPQGTLDPVHFEQAATEGRVLVTNDQPSIKTAHRWLREGRPFKAVLTWPKQHYARMTIGEIASKIEAITREEEPFRYPIRYIKPD